ncbi:Sensor histidine kinase LiaS [Rubripirellula lacrimiformis]|uniref:Sensor histidine kinase LiaS n=1 Tax=Rubripirellula lacrimiformis TaxID=1930273 RepID=A0A517NAB0_9BACT|nr:sensor histidine kinase [Rubripirellula lacrimiformis]QDT04074.1 Sensor histidine kinase LiaS [Rubripirellula lacrimiformis]
MPESQRNVQEALEIIEADRASLSHEIHDGLVPYLFAASAAAGRLRDDLAKAAFAEPSDQKSLLDRSAQVRDLVQQAMGVSRQILTQAYPPELAGTPWTAALKRIIDQWFSESPVQFDWRLADSVNDVSPEISVCLYRIAVEAIRNAVRHGKATTIRVQADTTDGSHRISVTDDGVGFDAKSIPDGHFGIRSMRGRAELIGGTFRLETQPGGPTRVGIEIPATSTG